jgi:hypothetical protein
LAVSTAVRGIRILETPLEVLSLRRSGAALVAIFGETRERIPRSAIFKEERGREANRGYEHAPHRNARKG